MWVGRTGRHRAPGSGPRTAMSCCQSAFGPLPLRAPAPCPSVPTQPGSPRSCVTRQRWQIGGTRQGVAASPPALHHSPRTPHRRPSLCCAPPVRLAVGSWPPASSESPGLRSPRARAANSKSRSTLSVPAAVPEPLGPALALAPTQMNDPSVLPSRNRRQATVVGQPFVTVLHLLQRSRPGTRPHSLAPNLAPTQMAEVSITVARWAICWVGGTAAKLLQLDVG